jgi:predicted glycogen debranching enzyme
MKLPALSFGQNVLSRFGEALGKEWLITNGLGGYSSSTVLGVNTRKYHGLLVASLHPPGERTVCLAKLDEDVLVGNDVFRLGTNEFKEAIYPEGYIFLTGFSASPFPTFSYTVSSFDLNKTVFMTKGKNGVAVIYKAVNHGPQEAKLRVYPLLTCRHFHAVVNRAENPWQFTQRASHQESEIVFTNPAVTVLCRVTDGEFHEKINWVDGLLYWIEAARGEISIDDCFQPGFFELNVPAGEDREFAVCTAADHSGEIARQTLDSIGGSTLEVHASLNIEQTQQRNLLYGFYGLHPEVPLGDWLSWVLLAADSFVVADSVGKKAVVAGYHWFESWGRDTFVSLPGLLLVSGRFNAARNILEAYSRFCKNGLIPNYVADASGEPSYNTVDGTLWYINAVLKYLKHTGDYPFVEAKLWSSLQDIVSSHEKGTHFDIGLDGDGLLRHGARLTWMDAEVNGEAVTPRAGKAVEIQALWYNALHTMRLLAEEFGEKDLAERYAAMANKAYENFNLRFWNPQLGCLYDVLEQNGVDASLRPNQVLAVSLDYPILDRTRWRPVVNLVDREFVTQHGLRTLAQSDPRYVGKYSGNRASRDRAYHNGTIWPWLLGPYISAYLKTENHSEPSRQHLLQKLVMPFFDIGIQQAGLGTISEIYDADQPNLPRGCIAQAWSIAEPLRAYIEDVLLLKPHFAQA